MNDLLRDISDQVKEAAHHKNKIAMFHLQVLMHAEELEDYTAKGVCAEIGVRETYATEYGKMIALRKLMKEKGITIKYSSKPIDTNK